MVIDFVGEEADWSPHNSEDQQRSHYGASDAGQNAISKHH
jgi:hypothetical protein